MCEQHWVVVGNVRQRPGGVDPGGPSKVEMQATIQRRHNAGQLPNLEQQPQFMWRQLVWLISAARQSAASRRRFARFCNLAGLNLD